MTASPRIEPPIEVARIRLAKVIGGADATGGDASGGAAGAMGAMGGMGGIGSIFQMAMPMIQGLMNKGQQQQAPQGPPQGPPQGSPGPGAPTGDGSSPGSQMAAAPGRRHGGAPNVSINVSVTR
ncbi:MAG TPA: hypothetical protein VGM88_26035 [Kofleriaceae bacterium]|jgi:hypothetical protein